jgi:hypothetical protein
MSGTIPEPRQGFSNNNRACNARQDLQDLQPRSGLTKNKTTGNPYRVNAEGDSLTPHYVRGY